MGDRAPVQDEPVLLSLGRRGQSLTVRVTRRFAPDAVLDAERGWLQARIEVEATPFTGLIETVLTPDDVEQYRAALETLSATGHSVLGGGRAPSIHLSRDGSVIEVTVTPAGDDPWPSLRYLIFPLANGVAE